MRTNLPIIAAFILLLILFIDSCTTSLPSKMDERDLRDYPNGKALEKKHLQDSLDTVAKNRKEY